MGETSRHRTYKHPGLSPDNGGIELHAPTNSTQKLKLMGKGGQFTYTPTGGPLN
jgi:hypothetical protein